MRSTTLNYEEQGLPGVCICPGRVYTSEKAHGFATFSGTIGIVAPILASVVFFTQKEPHTNLILSFFGLGVAGLTCAGITFFAYTKKVPQEQENDEVSHLTQHENISLNP